MKPAESSSAEAAALDLPDALLRKEAWPHACSELRLVETHLSWVFLTGPFAYKVKKPVDLGFANFRSLEDREHFCREELRCNQAFAPELYRDVVPIVRGTDGAMRVAPAEGGRPGDWAVRMEQFDPDRALDVQIEKRELDAGLLRDFGRRLAEQHRGLPRFEGRFDLAQRVRAPVLDNFSALERARLGGERIQQLKTEEAVAFGRIQSLLASRAADGFVRECHGDLHLSNLVQLQAGITAFDCIEFDPALRWIDVASDISFLMMDCEVRERRDLSYAFADGYFDASGDYDGARLLPYYRAYRSLVRAKVAELQRADAAQARRNELEARREAHLRFAEGHLSRPAGALWIMCGLSGSGKSWLAERLAPELAAIRLRSDVVRQAGGRTEPKDERYSGSARAEVYEDLARLSARLVAQGENVLVDATFLDRGMRMRFAEIARSSGSEFRVLFCDAPVETLRERIVARQAKAEDPSEADLDVLSQQLATFRPPENDEDVLRIDSTSDLRADAVAALLENDARLLQRIDG